MLHGSGKKKKKKSSQEDLPGPVGSVMRKVVIFFYLTFFLCDYDHGSKPIKTLCEWTSDYYCKHDLCHVVSEDNHKTDNHSLFAGFNSEHFFFPTRTDAQKVFLAVCSVRPEPQSSVHLYLISEADTGASEKTGPVVQISDHSQYGITGGITAVSPPSPLLPSPLFTYIII